MCTSSRPSDVTIFSISFSTRSGKLPIEQKKRPNRPLSKVSCSKAVEIITPATGGYNSRLRAHHSMERITKTALSSSTPWDAQNIRGLEFRGVGRFPVVAEQGPLGGRVEAELIAGDCAKGDVVEVALVGCESVHAVNRQAALRKPDPDHALRICSVLGSEENAIPGPIQPIDAEERDSRRNRKQPDVARFHVDRENAFRVIGRVHDALIR